jgi:anthranilate phosphoribosyltransferase
MKKVLQFLFEYKSLDREKAKEVLLNISKGVYNEHEITAFMTVYLMRSVTIAELQGFRDALLELCVNVELDGLRVTDIVGTGGPVMLHCCRHGKEGRKTWQLWRNIH